MRISRQRLVSFLPSQAQMFRDGTKHSNPPRLDHAEAGEASHDASPLMIVVMSKSLSRSRRYTWRKAIATWRLVVAKMAVRLHRRLDVAQEPEELITSDVKCDMVGREVERDQAGRRRGTTAYVSATVRPITPTAFRAVLM